MASLGHTGRNRLLLSLLEYHLKENVFLYFKQKTRKQKISFTRSHGLLSNVRLHLRFRSEVSFFASLFIVLACTLGVFVPVSGQFKSGMRCIWAGLRLCQEDNPLMTNGQHFHPSESDLSEAEVALSLHKITLGINKTQFGVSSLRTVRASLS